MAAGYLSAAMTLRRFAWITLGYNLAVIVWGAFVRASGSGAGCGRHWPLCNGQVVPRAPAVETVIELTHRVTSGLALLLVVALVVWAFRTTAPGHRVRRAAALSLVFIIIEALVGAGLVLLELVGGNDSLFRAGYLAVHLANTFFLIGFLVLVAVWADRPSPSSPPRPTTLTRWSQVTLVAVLIVGATGAVTALGDTLFPAETLRQGLAQHGSDAHFLLRLRVIHPALAILTGLLAIGVGSRVLARPELAEAHLAARWLIGLVVIQMAVGTINLVLLVPIITQLLHLLVADGIWIAGWVMAAGTRLTVGGTDGRAGGVVGVRDGTVETALADSGAP